MAAAGSPSRDRGRQLDRVNAFSDGLFTIAATLLVLSIDIPNGPAKDLNGDLSDLASSTYTYFLSFAVIGLFWLRHHELFGRLRYSDQRFAALNLVFLSFVALMPAPTELLGRYGGQTASVVIYGTNLLLLSVLLRVLHDDARRRGLLEDDPWDGPNRTRSNVVIGLTSLSIPLGFVAPHVAPYLWVCPFLVPLLGRLSRSVRSGA
jgi:uncharacterized membrane protein